MSKVNAYKLLINSELIMANYDKDLKRLLIWLIGGSRGGLMRYRILEALRKRPMNPNQLAKYLNVNYRTVLYHLEILERNGLIVKAGEGYGAPYLVSDELNNKWSILVDIIRMIGLRELNEGDE
ncbi:ArsR/SmtB family transcription factor [Caldivirga maquilingensis]|uniref:Regulatory protein ArsR n=1 Tax=Caldivirga maquilingensis (strain ATCC 700844 / DSM 13496 / JCM 10307 / IC-167) TaxID=397948 RepID=A8MAE5_CALMQ|nr:winged helix-turn-helix domain-containing protein [Caldivirga maquilingensis]ABW02522.1 regulatory protein ArsR [Caldivirga maquilingensis IC-167]